MVTEDFKVVEAPLAELAGSEVQVRNEWMSLDPYMRLGLTQQSGYVSALGPGDILSGPAIGVIEHSRNSAFPEGSRVISQMGWRSRFVADPAHAGLSLLDDRGVAPEWHLGLLGLTGITAWLGIERVLRPLAGETLFVSGASGAVGSIACQLAKLRGARVIGSAGSEDKVQWLLNEIGVDAVVNYRTASLEDFLTHQAPEGVDCYFDNIGGTMLETFLTRTRAGGRIGLCGAMSQYEGGDYRSGPRNFFAAIENNLRLEGFNAFRLAPDEWTKIAGELAELAGAERIKPCHTVVEGIANVPAAFARMFDGGQNGKLIVRI